mmetsp:Transcript_55897/g.130593  ORF Transcript_55897/g.130593 Transcript_55897/m.130593 type:complete len:409 (+) Transcript_55897:30-1256(+)
MRRKGVAFRRAFRLIFPIFPALVVLAQRFGEEPGSQEPAFLGPGARPARAFARKDGLHAKQEPAMESEPAKTLPDFLDLEGEGLWKAVTVFNAACWGSSYISSKAGIDALAANGVEDAPIVFGALRFSLAALPLLPWLLRSSATESARTSAVVGSLNGLSYAAIFTSYAYGTTGGKAAFITSLQTIVVAACSCIAARRLQLSTAVSAIMAVVGVGFLELAGGSMETTLGDFICLAAPLAIGLGWYILGGTMKKYPEDTLPSVSIQFTCFTVLFVTWTLGDVAWRHGPSGLSDWLSQAPALLQTPGLWPPLLFSTFMGNVFTMLLANRAVQFIKVSEVSLIVASEPLWAALAAMLYLGEVFTLGDVIGGGFILTALVLNELWEENSAEEATLPAGEKEKQKEKEPELVN